MKDINSTLLKTEERQRCEVWTRVMGYYRPVSQFNAGKQSEHHERLHFKEPDKRGVEIPLREAICSAG